MPRKKGAGQFVKGDPRAGRPRKTASILKTLDDSLRGKITDEKGDITEIPGFDAAVRVLYKKGIESKDNSVIVAMLKMARQEALEDARLESEEQKLKERKLSAAIQKYELENTIKQQRAEQRAKKEDAETSIKRLKAEQEEIKTRIMIGEYIPIELMRYYFTFYQRAINDSYAGVRALTNDIKRLFAKNKDIEAENQIISIVRDCFTDAIKKLDKEIEKDIKNDSTSKESK